MSKIIYVCLRNPSSMAVEKDRVKRVCDNLTPDNLDPHPAIVTAKDNVIIGIFNPVPTIMLKASSVCLGNLLGSPSEWHQPRSKIPDGTYALIRGNSNEIEAIADYVGSRTIWYVHTKDLFIASTSQRMIIAYLGSYHPDRNVYSWILSTGSLGPGLSWDQRIKCLPGNSRFILNRESWTARLVQRTVRFQESNLSYQDHYERLKKAIEVTMSLMRIDYAEWVLTLSGGYDSRTILLHLPNPKKINTLTWGLKHSIKEKNSDAYIAKKIADYIGCPHQYYPTDLSAHLSLRTLFDRFLSIGEGRIDHFSGYADGFYIWNKLHAHGVSGVIRGDEGFGWVSCKDEQDVRFRVGMPLLTDFVNLTDPLHQIGIAPNSLPPHLNRKKTESIPLWRDRLYHQYRIPSILAALNDLKLSHVEIANPFLSRRIILEARKLPDHLRTSKKLYKDIANNVNPGIDYAQYRATARTKDLLNQNETIAFLKKEIRHSKVLPNSLKNLLDKEMAPRPNKIRHHMNINVLGFRAFIIARMNTILTKDAGLL
ncbi:hypothetical protein RB298_02005 [Priestia sp. BR_2]